MARNYADDLLKDGSRWHYTTEQWEFIAAMAALQKRLGRQPTWPEVLQEAKRLGYRPGRAYEPIPKRKRNGPDLGKEVRARQKAAR